MTHSDDGTNRVRRHRKSRSSCPFLDDGPAVDLHDTVRVRRGGQDPRRRDENLSLWEMSEQCGAALWIELGQHIVKDQYRRPSSDLGDEAMDREP